MHFVRLSDVSKNALIALTLVSCVAACSVDAQQDPVTERGLTTEPPAPVKLPSDQSAGGGNESPSDGGVAPPDSPPDSGTSAPESPPDGGVTPPETPPDAGRQPPRRRRSSRASRPTTVLRLVARPSR
jgi:hypothetical protein